MDNIIKVKCDNNLKKVLPLLCKSFSSSLSEEDFELSDDEIYNFDEDINDKYVIFLLNTLGQIFDVSTEEFDSNKYIEFDNKVDQKLVNELIEEAKDNDYFISNESNKILIDTDFYNNKLCLKIPYSTIIIKYDIESDFIFEESWIKNNYNEKEIIISSKGKKLGITIDDILYISKAIAVINNNQFIINSKEQQFKLISVNDNTLILQY